MALYAYSMNTDFYTKTYKQILKLNFKISEKFIQSRQIDLSDSKQDFLNKNFLMVHL